MKESSDLPSFHNSLPSVKPKNELMVQEASRASRQLAIANKIGSELTLNDEHRRWVELLTYCFKFKKNGATEVTKFLSKYAPISKNLLVRYEEFWDWEALSDSQYLSWTPELIERFKERWYWGTSSQDVFCFNPGLSNNAALPLTLELIEHFKSQWDWRDLSNNKAIPWTIDLIEYFEEEWYWGWFFDSERYGEGLSSAQELPWTLELIERFKERWDWTLLSSNESLPWSLELLERFKDYWVWAYGSEEKVNNDDSIFDTKIVFTGYGVTENKSIPWNLELIECFKERWDWEYLSSCKELPWSEALIECYEKRWDWYWLSKNESLPWSEKLISQFEDNWDWYCLARNKIITSSEELTEVVKWYVGHNDWESWEDQSFEYNSDSYEDINYWFNGGGNYYWNKEYGAQPNGFGGEALPWSVELLEKYQVCLHWDRLSGGNVLPWTLGLLERFKDRWDLGEVSNFYELPLTERDIDEIMRNHLPCNKEAKSNSKEDVKSFEKPKEGPVEKNKEAETTTNGGFISKLIKKIWLPKMKS